MSSTPQTPLVPTPSATPAMRQYLETKRQYRDAIVWFRIGDFYEMFYEDALVAARALDLTLTSRTKDADGVSIPMCGVPHHAAETYLARLVQKGFRVAICEQVEDPRKAKGIVRREVVRVVSPGTLTDTAYLDAREPAYLLALVPPDARSDRAVVGAAVMDLSTGEFRVAEFDGATARDALRDELDRVRPRELVVPDGFDVAAWLGAPERPMPPVTRVEAWTFEHESARRTLLDQFGTPTLDGFGLEERPAAVRAAGGLVRYLRDTQKADLTHVRAVELRLPGDALVLDPATLRHLEVVEGAGGGRHGSLLDIIDRTVTPMGGRLLRAWLLSPLRSLERIHDRLDAVEDLGFHATARAKLRETLKAVQDLERLVARVSLGTAGPRDLVALKRSIAAVPRVRAIAAELSAPLVCSLSAALDDLRDVRDAIETTLVDDAPALARDGGAIRDGVDAELDELRRVSREGKTAIAALEADERRRTGIASLKVRYNRVFGYYIEVSKANLGAVPPDYQRKQTVAGGERFVTPALKAYEAQVLGADERLVEREVEIFERLRRDVAAEAPRILDVARAVATLDVLAALAETAAVHDYTKPVVHEGDEYLATEARHPIVERFMPDPFVPNDIHLDATDRRLVIVTGPNMGGKSTYLRQTALIAILAHVGSFVPAKTAKVPIVDRIFARVGASDDLARGRSTFMVEMQETAHILHSATSRSLVILDEVGRGTATFDGLSLAWAVAEHLATNPRARPKTLFATHYHELTDLADAVPGVANLHVVVREWRDEIVFLRKVVPGRSDRSYGIQVARLAGLPPSVVARARAILDALERDELSRGGRPSFSDRTRLAAQPSLFEADPSAAAIVERLRAVDVDRLTPLEALSLLAELIREAKA